MTRAGREAELLLESFSTQVFAMTDVGLRALLRRLDHARQSPLDVGAGPIGDPMAEPVAVRSDGIAVIQIAGDIVPKASALAERYLGLVSLERVQAQFQQAMGDPKVTGILFDVDSPGGLASGVADLADEIRAGRGKKPMVALANDMAASAAYWLASAADRVVLTRSADVGSIGTIAVHVDESGLLERMGVKLTAVKAGEKKDQWAWWKPLSEEARADLQAMVDATNAVFVDGVATSRGLTASAVKGFEAGIFRGADAITAGLADAVTTADRAPRELRTGGPQQLRAGADQLPAAEGVTMTDEEKAAQAAADAAKVKDAAEAAVKTDRARGEEIRDLCALAGRPELAAEFITTGAEPVAVRAELRKLQAQAKAPSTDGTHGEGGEAAPQQKSEAPNRAAIFADMNRINAQARGIAA